jgi:hypothetical protein
MSLSYLIIISTRAATHIHTRIVTDTYHLSSPLTRTLDWFQERDPRIMAIEEKIAYLVRSMPLIRSQTRMNSDAQLLSSAEPLQVVRYNVGEYYRCALCPPYNRSNSISGRRVQRHRVLRTDKHPLSAIRFSGSISTTRRASPSSSAQPPSSCTCTIRSPVRVDSNPGRRRHAMPPLLNNGFRVAKRLVSRRWDPGEGAGGATYFPKAMMLPYTAKHTRGIRVFPRAGEALLFWNIGVDGREVRTEACVLTPSLFSVNMMMMTRLRHTGAQLGARRGARVGGREVDLHQVAQAVVGPPPPHPHRLPWPISSASWRGESRHCITSIAQPTCRPLPRTRVCADSHV